MPDTFKEQIDAFISFLKFEKGFPGIPYWLIVPICRTLICSCCVFEGIAFTELDYQHIRSWLADLKENKLTARSINRKISTLKSFLNTI